MRTPKLLSMHGLPKLCTQCSRGARWLRNPYDLVRIGGGIYSKDARCDNCVPLDDAEREWLEIDRPDLDAYLDSLDSAIGDLIKPWMLSHEAFDAIWSGGVRFQRARDAQRTADGA